MPRHSACRQQPGRSRWPGFRVPLHPQPRCSRSTGSVDEHKEVLPTLRLVRGLLSSKDAQTHACPTYARDRGSGWDQASANRQALRQPANSAERRSPVRGQHDKRYERLPRRLQQEQEHDKHGRYMVRGATTSPPVPIPKGNSPCRHGVDQRDSACPHHTYARYPHEASRRSFVRLQSSPGRRGQSARYSGYPFVRMKWPNRQVLEQSRFATPEYEQGCQPRLRRPVRTW